MTAAFWFDWKYDENHADTGTGSRYGNYLYGRKASFREVAGDFYDDPTVPFACLAWRIATGPIMAPPLVCSHQRIHAATVERSNWNGEATADVELVAPRPDALVGARPADGSYFADWPRSYSGHYEGIGEEDLTRKVYLLTQVRLLVQLPPGILPKIGEVPTAGPALFEQAVACLNALVGALNRELQPILDRLEPDQ
jgi:hypothetical protein